MRGGGAGGAAAGVRPRRGGVAGGGAGGVRRACRRVGRGGRRRGRDDAGRSDVRPHDARACGLRRALSHPRAHRLPRGAASPNPRHGGGERPAARGGFDRLAAAPQAGAFRLARPDRLGARLPLERGRAPVRIALPHGAALERRDARRAGRRRAAPRAAAGGRSAGRGAGGEGEGGRGSGRGGDCGAGRGGGRGGDRGRRGPWGRGGL